MNKFFKIQERGSSIKTEIIGGLTTFFAMAYIICVNPAMLGATGMDAVGVAVATCAAAFLGTMLTALLANVPFAQAPGMGLNAFFTYTVCFGFGYTWQQALTIVLISGVIFFAVSVSPLRKKIINSIPASLKAAISAGIGLFIAFIGLVDGGVVSFGGVPAFNNITKGGALLCIIGIIIIAILMVLKVKGAIFIGILATAVVGLVPTLCGWHIFGEFVTEGSSLYEISAIGNVKDVAFKFDFAGIADNGIVTLIAVILSFAIVDCFDTVGTLIGTAGNAGLLKEDGTMEDGDKALIADAVATCAGACLGTSTVTTFVESSAGISEGARTGLSSVVVSLMFAVSVLITPIFAVLDKNKWFLFGISCPALIIVGVLMIKSVLKINWNDIEEAIPCFLTIAVMPFAYSISDGIAFGFISYVILKLVRKKAKEVPVLVYILAALFLARYVLINL